MTRREAIFPEQPHALYEQHGYSPATRAGDLVFVSGQVGAHPDGTPEPDMVKQAELAFENLNAVLAAAGGTIADAVDVTFFMVDPETTFEKVFPVIRRHFPGTPHPSVTAVGATWLAGFHFEIKVVALIPQAA